MEFESQRVARSNKGRVVAHTQQLAQPERLCCHWCEQPASATTPRLMCSKCKETHYCSQQCQRWDYKSIHKKICGTFFASSRPEVDLVFAVIGNHQDQHQCQPHQSNNNNNNNNNNNADGFNSNSNSKNNSENNKNPSVNLNLPPTEVLTYGYVLLRTRNDEIHYHSDIYSPRRGCVYEVLGCVPQKLVQQRFSDSKTTSKNKESRIQNENQQDAEKQREIELTLLSDDSDGQIEEEEEEEYRPLGWVDNPVLKTRMFEEYMTTRHITENR